MKKRKYSTSMGSYETIKKTPYKKRKTTNKSLLMKLKKSVFQHEKKFIDVNISSGYNTSGTATITLLNACTQGSDETNRIGRQLNMKSIFVRGQVTSALTTTGIGLIRTILVLDQEVPQVSGVGQVMLITDFLVSDNLESLNNLNNRKRFKVLWDDVADFAGVATSNNGGNKTSHELYFYKKIDKTVEFNSADNGNIGDFTKNALYLITYQYGMATTALGTVINTRVRFTDN